MIKFHIANTRFPDNWTWQPIPQLPNLGVYQCVEFPYIRGRATHEGEIIPYEYIPPEKPLQVMDELTNTRLILIRD